MASNRLCTTLLSVALIPLTMYTAEEQPTVKLERAQLPEQKYTKALAISFSGGIQSLCCAKKDDQLILLIGHARVSTWSIGPYSFADDKAQELLLPYFDAWQKAPDPITFVSLDNRATCQRHAEKLAQTSQSSPEFHRPLQCIINGRAHSANYTLGSLSVCTLPDEACFESTHWNPATLFTYEFFPDLAERSKLIVDKSTQLMLNDIRDIEARIGNSSLDKQKAFFDREGRFKQFIEVAQEDLRTQGHTMTIKEYLEMIAKITVDVERFMTDTHPLAAFAHVVHSRLTHTPVTIRSFLAAVGCTDMNMSLFEALCFMIKAKRQLNSVAIEFTHELVGPFHSYQTLITLNTLTEKVHKNKRVVCLIPYPSMVPFSQVLREAGYTIACTGFLPTDGTAGHTMSSSPFSKEDIEQFFYQHLGATLDESLVPEERLFHTYSNGPELHRTLSETLQQLSLQAQSKKKCSGMQLPQMRIIQCQSCQQMIPKDHMYVSYKKGKKGLCSIDCFAALLLKSKAPKLETFLAQERYTKQERRTLEHMAALCYLRTFTLSPALSLNEGEMYAQNTGNWIELLKLIEQQGAKDEQWREALSLLKPLLINPTNIVQTLELHRSLKQAYLQHCKEFSAAQRKGLSPYMKLAKPVFDTEGKLIDLLAEQYRTLHKAFSLPTIPDTHYPRVYYHLMKRLQHRCQFTIHQLAKSLAVTLPGSDLHDLIPTRNKKK